MKFCLTILLLVMGIPITGKAAGPMPPKVKPLTLTQAKARIAAKAKALNPPQKRGTTPTVAMVKAPVIVTHDNGTCMRHMHADLVLVEGVRKMKFWMRHPVEEFWSLSMNSNADDPWGWFTPPSFECIGGMSWVYVPFDSPKMFCRARYWPTIVGH